jgi:hypothetical protein
MRTTVRLPDDLLRAVKESAARTGRTITQVIEDALRQSLSSRGASEKSRDRYRVKTYGEGGVRPGVDLGDTAALLDLMEGHDRP